MLDDLSLITLPKQTRAQQPAVGALSPCFWRKVNATTSFTTCRQACHEAFVCILRSLPLQTEICKESCSQEHRKWSPREVAVSRVSGRNVRDGKFGKPGVTKRFQRAAKGIQPSVPALPTEQAVWPTLWMYLNQGTVKDDRVLSRGPSTGTRIHYLKAASLDVIEKEAQREREERSNLLIPLHVTA